MILIWEIPYRPSFYMTCGCLSGKYIGELGALNTDFHERETKNIDGITVICFI